MGALILAACGGGSSTAPTPAPSSTPALGPRPNIVLVLADDLDYGITQILPRLPIVMGQAGLTFSRAYVTTALCAPSRASILTGQYAHNHGLVYNEPPDGGFPQFRGKDLNGYPHGAPETYIPPGWDDWFGHLSDFEDGRYYNYWMNDNGNVLRYGSSPDEYSVDVIARRAVDFVQ